MSNKAGHLFEFGPYRLDTRERLLMRSGDPIRLTPKVFDLLQFLVENRGKLIEKEELIRQLWPDSFVEDANLSVNMSALRKALGEAPGEHRFIETIPKKGYRFSADVRDVSTVEIQPPPVPVTPVRTSRRPWLLMSVVLFATGLAGVLWTLKVMPWNRNNDPKLRRIAVLPFRNLSGRTEDEYLGAGIADTLAAKLSKMHEIIVPAANTVRTVTQSQSDLTAIAQKLEAEALLTGSIQRLQDQLRINVQLIRAKDASAIWAETFDGTFSNVFSFEDSIAQSVAIALSVQATEGEHADVAKRYTENTEAYALYMQGVYSASRRNREDNLKAIEFFQAAAHTDPRYALPHAQLAFLDITLAGAGMYPDYWAKARQEAQLALSLDPQLPDAHRALGVVLMRADWNWAGAEKEFRETMRLNPNLAAAHSAWSTLLTALARHEEAIAEMQLATRLDPGSAPHRADLAWTYYCARNYPRAVEESRRALTLDYNSNVSHREYSKQLMAAGQFAEARHEYQEMTRLAGRLSAGSPADLGVILASSGKKDEARKIYDELKQTDRLTVSNYEYSMAMLAGALGQQAEALDWLGKAVNLHLARAIWMRVDPEMDPLRTSPRFDELVKSVHLR